MRSLTLIIMMTFGFACLGAVIQKGASGQIA